MVILSHVVTTPAGCGPPDPHRPPASGHGPDVWILPLMKALPQRQFVAYWTHTGRGDVQNLR